MRKDKLRNVLTVVGCLDEPATEAEIERRTGLKQTTTNRAIATAVALGLVYQSGWSKASRYVPIYSRGPIPEGFVLPPMPQGMTDRERRKKWKDENPERHKARNREYDRRKRAREQATRSREAEERKRIAANVFAMAYTYRRKSNDS